MPKPFAVAMQLVLLLCCFSLISSAQPIVKKTFAFKLSQSCTTSAGVYKKDGTLVRTLWSGVTYAAGRQVQEWDGLDDDGKPSGDTDVDIKILSNNVKYEWEGAQIGNTSTAFTGETKLRLFEPVKGMAIAGNTAYFAGGYNEGWPAQFKTSLSDPNIKTWIGRMKSTDQASDYVATDGINVYWGGYDPLESKSLPETFVFATSVLTDKQVPFIKGVPAQMNWGGIYTHTIAYQKAKNSIISGLAVQKVGLYLFVARATQNNLQVLNKVTGDVVQSIKLSDVRKCLVDKDDNLWLVHSKKVEKFKVNTNGTLSSLGVTVPVSNAAALSISADNITLLVADMESQQVKAFNNINGMFMWTLGQQGGYLTNATVTDDKFYWKDVRNELVTFLCYLPNGSFYVGDVGNVRVQRYSANRIFLDRIMFLQNVYNTSVDKSNPKRVFSDFLEFEVDYATPMGANNGSWKLMRNWGGNFGGQFDQFNKVLSIATLTNGRTYGLTRIEDKYFLVELVNGGALRYTGIKLPQRTQIMDDGSKLISPGTRIGFPCTLLRYPIIGFDKNNDPIWSPTPESLSESPSVKGTDPVPWEGFRGDVLSASNNVIYFDYTRTDNNHSNGYHLGAIKRGTNKWLWKTAKSTSTNYTGPFPDDGTFDCGNGVVAHGAGGSCLIKGDNIFWGYHGEFWKQSQTNKWNHVDANTGLFVGQFGVLTTDYPDEEAFAAGAGNVLAGSIVEVNGNTYLYHNDESVHGGVHRWKITGLNSINVQLAVPATDIIVVEGIDLLAGIQRNVVLNNGFGWDRGTEPDEFKTNKWNVTTGVKTYDPTKSPDINIIFSVKNSKRILKRELGNNTDLKSWKLVGKMNFDRSAPTEYSFKRQSFVEVLDNNNRIIARFDIRQDLVSGQNIFGNEKLILKGTDKEIARLKSYTQPIEISADNGNISFSYAGLPVVTTKNKVDNDANWQAPKWLRFYFENTPAADDYLMYFNISAMRFIGNTITQQPVQPQSPAAGCNGTGKITWDYWPKVPWGNTIKLPLSNTPSKTITVSNFSSPINYADSFGARMRGFICPPVTGGYIFFISGDDRGELYLSKTENPADKVKIATLDSYTGYLDNWRYSSQRSAQINLEAGKKYYIEAIYQDNYGDDYLTVSWALPNGTIEAPIEGRSLIPFSNQPYVPPSLPGAPANVPNVKPTVSILSPENSFTVEPKTSVTISATAADTDGTIAKVEFFVDGLKVGEQISKPFLINYIFTAAGVYSITVKATDDKGGEVISSPVRITAAFNYNEICTGKGGLLWEYWINKDVTSTKDLPLTSAPSGSSILSSFSTPTYFADYFGDRTSGYICPSVTGDYTFYISGDEVGELYLSPNSNPAEKVKIAFFNGWTGINEYFRLESQHSKTISLVANQKYYVEALHFDKKGADHLNVAWKLPNGTMQVPIPGNNLIPFTSQSLPGNSKASQARSTNKPTVEEVGSIKESALLLKVSPNPFVNQLNINCIIPVYGAYTLQLYSMQGILLKTIFNGTINPGKSRFMLSASQLLSGVYVLRLSSGKTVINTQVSLIK